MEVERVCRVLVQAGIFTYEWSGELQSDLRNLYSASALGFIGFRVEGLGFRASGLGYRAR